MAVAAANLHLTSYATGSVTDTLQGVLKVRIPYPGDPQVNIAYFRFSLRDSASGALVDTLYATLQVDQDGNIDLQTNLAPADYNFDSGKGPGTCANFTFKPIRVEGLLAPPSAASQTAGPPAVLVYLEGGTYGTSGIPALTPWGYLLLSLLIVLAAAVLLRRAGSVRQGAS